MSFLRGRVYLGSLHIAVRGEVEDTLHGTRESATSAMPAQPEKSRGAVSLMSCVRKAMSAFSVSQFTRGSPYSGTGKVGESLQRYIVYNWTSVHDRVHDDRSRESPYSGTAKASLALALFSGKECKVRIIIQGSTVNRRSARSTGETEKMLSCPRRRGTSLPPVRCDSRLWPEIL